MTCPKTLPASERYRDRDPRSVIRDCDRETLTKRLRRRPRRRLLALLMAAMVPLMVGTMLLVLLSLHRTAAKILEEGAERLHVEADTRLRIGQMQDVIERIAERLEYLRPHAHLPVEGDETQPDAPPLPHP